ncbi:MAG: glycosyltransferase [Candidatus Aminicenantes bacterium]|nr:MAG: glycosyltransferase [Candidatus Aminicenantes bacterium]
MKNQLPVVAHINHSFFAKSETFIYNYISNLKRYHPICLTWELANLEQFPFPKGDLYSISLRIFALKWLLERDTRRYFSRHSFAKSVIKERDAKLIHAHFGPESVYALRLKRSLRIPLITTFYGYDISKLAQRKRWMSRYKILFEEGDLFLVEGSHMKSMLVDLKCPEEKIQIQRISIPLNRILFRPRKPKKKGESVVLLFSGRFEEKKGLLYALKAVEEAKERSNNIEFRLIGDGSLKPKIEEFIKTHRMGDYVQILGFLNYDDYLKEMLKADIFIHPSITASDGNSEGGAPTTILEAQATGLPVISTYHADIPNVVVPGKSALLSREKDYKATSEHIEYLLKNQDAWEQMGHVGRDFVEAHHNVKKEVDVLEQKYDFLMKKTFL